MGSQKHTRVRIRVKHIHTFAAMALTNERFQYRGETYTIRSLVYVMQPSVVGYFSHDAELMMQVRFDDLILLQTRRKLCRACRDRLCTSYVAKHSLLPRWGGDTDNDFNSEDRFNARRTTGLPLSSAW